MINASPGGEVIQRAQVAGQSPDKQIILGRDFHGALAR